MLSWLRSLVQSRPPKAALLNEGLELAMNWGEEWLSPINARLRERHPYLGVDELEELNSTCLAAMRVAYEAVHVALHDEQTSPEIKALAQAVRGQHPWVNDENLSRLLKQGTYYAAKMGSHGRQA